MAFSSCQRSSYIKARRDGHAKLKGHHFTSKSTGLYLKFRNQKDRSRSGYVTESFHVDQNPVIKEIKAFFVVDPSTEAW
jgi:hypothetical protein